MSAKMSKSEKKFEEELKELEEVVARIDSGELSLEDAIGAFERGVGLVKSLNQKLDEVEKKVELLVRNSQGQLATTPLKENSGNGEDEDLPF